MANAITPRQQGDDYQARFFWLQACRLFQPHTKVARVGFELSRVKSFDDVVVTYAEPLCYERGDKIAADYFQVKFHVSQAGAFTCDALIDPIFINATSVSLLQRLRDAQLTFAPDGDGCRFIIVSPWVIHPDDPLANLVSNNGGELRLQVLFDGTTDASRMGKVRKKWRDHLGLTDEELEKALRPLRIFERAPTLVGLSEDLNRQLDSLGFVPVEAGTLVHPYDDLIKKLLAQGSNEFSRDELQEAVRRERLWRGRNGGGEGKEPAPIGIRSFMRWAEHMEDETEDMLCLVRHFDNRNIRDRALWQDAVLPEVRDFMSRHVRPGGAAHLMLDAHASIAFAAGYFLESKSGADVVPVQRTRSGLRVWRPDPEAEGAAAVPGWSYSDQELHTGGDDVAVALSVTHDVPEDVKDFVGRELPAVGRVMSFAAAPRPGPASIRDATHALALAQEVAARLKGRTRDERTARVHVFAAAPNAFMFFLGQLAKGFGPCTVYEYDFDTNAPGAYQASISFPPR